MLDIFTCSLVFRTIFKCHLLTSLLSFSYLKTKTFGGGGGGARGHLNVSAAGNRNKETSQKEKSVKSEGKHEGVYRELVRLTNQHKVEMFFLYRPDDLLFFLTITTGFVQCIMDRCENSRKAFIKNYSSLVENLDDLKNNFLGWIDKKSSN